MGYYHPVPKKGNQGDIAMQYGVAPVNYPRPGTENSRGGFRSIKDVERDISAAMSNDYSTREFLKYNDEARKEMKNGLPSNRKQNSKLYEMMKDAHKDNGNGGKYSSTADRAGVAQEAFENFEDSRDAGLRKDFRKMLKKNNKKMAASQNTEAAVAPEIGLSDAAKESQSLLDKYTTGITGSTLGRDTFNSSDPFDTRGAELGAESPGATQPGGSGVEDVVDESPIDSTNENLEEAMDFKNKYSFNVASGLNLAGIKTSGKGATKFGA